MRHPRDYARNRPGNGNASRRRHAALYPMNKIERRPAIGVRSAASLPALLYRSQWVGAWPADRRPCRRECRIWRPFPHLFRTNSLLDLLALIERLGPVDTHLHLIDPYRPPWTWPPCGINAPRSITLRCLPKMSQRLYSRPAFPLGFAKALHDRTLHADTDRADSPIIRRTQPNNRPVQMRPCG